MTQKTRPPLTHQAQERPRLRVPVDSGEPGQQDAHEEAEEVHLGEAKRRLFKRARVDRRQVVAARARERQHDGGHELHAARERAQVLARVLVVRCWLFVAGRRVV